MNIVFALMIIFNSSNGVTSQVLHFKTRKECESVHKQVSNYTISTIGCMEVVK